MNIFRYDDVSLLFMIELSQKYGQTRLSLSDISRRHGISALFLKKIARKLMAKQLVKSKEGKWGGYELSQAPSQITVWDVMSAFSNRTEYEAHFSTHYSVCPLRKNCLPQQVHNTIGEVMEKSFSSVTLDDLMKKGRLHD